jgi:uncharacterized membrane protein YecN with MAPEG domain
MRITALYAGLLAPLFVWLCVRVIGARRASKVAVGDGGNPDLVRRMRVQANFAEYVPFALLLIALAESQGSPAWLLHGLGAVLLAARLAHGVGMSQPQENFALRGAGMAGTFTVLLGAAAACLGGFIFR